VVGVTAYLQPAQDITVGGRIARAAFQYTLQDPNIAELTEWAGKMLAKMKTLPEIVDVGTDLLFNSPQLKVTINRDSASRFGISAQMIDDTADEAICEAVTMPNMRFVPTKTREQQSCLMLHRTRRLFIRQQTAIINSIRAHLPSSGNRRDVNGWKGRTARNAERSIRRSGQPTWATALSNARL
jgi:hypothetical protein